MSFFVRFDLYIACRKIFGEHSQSYSACIKFIKRAKKRFLFGIEIWVQLMFDTERLCLDNFDFP